MKQRPPIYYKDSQGVDVGSIEAGGIASKIAELFGRNHSSVMGIFG